MFSCNNPAHHNLLSKSCFRVMMNRESGLRFNGGEIASSFLFDRDSRAALTDKVNKNISDVLKHSCRHWTDHLRPPQLFDTADLRHSLSDFLKICVLFWTEATASVKQPVSSDTSTCVSVGFEGRNSLS
jgi:hypothetical protein